MNTVKAMEILLPAQSVDKTKWAVVACDQFTSQHDYWDLVNELTKGVASTRHITLPEIYLPAVCDQMIDNINATIDNYLKEGVLQSIGKCFVLTVRNTPYTPKRVGLVISIDLEDYDYRVGSASLIRATEGTVVERIPPRVRIRKDAAVELPHIMVLFDDKEDKVLKPLYENRHNLPKLYDFDLMMDGGHLCGYKVDNTDEIIQKFSSLIHKGMLFAMGDGNHSLATAKAIWEDTKQGLTAEQMEEHPARYALVEAVNLYDEGLVFEPIHRVIFGADDKLVEKLSEIGGERKCVLRFKKRDIEINLPPNAVEAVKAAQEVIDQYIKQNKNASVDYVHGEKDTKQVADDADGIALLLPTLAKEELFDYVLEKGVLPRKTFSMGEAQEKRYYMEAKRIK